MSFPRWIVIGALVSLVAACGQNALGKSDGPPTYPPQKPSLPADMPLNHVDNNAWKDPKDMTEDDTRACETIAGWLRPKLEALHAKQDFTVESTRKAIADFGYPDAGVSQLYPRYDNTGTLVTPPGVMFGFSIRGGCIKGDVTPQRALVVVEGSIADAGCMPPPPTH
ncbi:hypothetical protein LWC34_31860 [Kibdelosporangium philippinense]|uniref:DUF3558 domain-containing protein n=1 Tax=Kibdelosporangium philippinense TaxID=211113 RepID=A0ABS8ZHU4_9PSEU|nr:hypothetical protein [Kibdelosporangium philippinense]MCE7007379.1 hypothetical protein [Kibdelosporangium philippinense]